MQKKVFLAFIVSAMAAIVAFTGNAQEKPQKIFKVSTILEGKNIFKVGEKIVFKTKSEYPADYFFGAWQLFAYVNNVPKDFCSKPNLKVKKNGDPKWSSVHINSCNWFPLTKRTEKEALCSFSTKDWPAGDYRVGINFIFPGKDAKVPTVYKQSFLLFTLEN